MSDNQQNYKHLYLYLFNQITNALEILQRGQPANAEALLRHAQQCAESMWIDMNPDE